LATPEGGFAGLRGLLGVAQVPGDALRRLYPVALQDLPRLLEGRRVGGGEAARYGRGVVAYDVREEEGEGGGGGCQARQAAALEDRNVLADGVDLAYIRPAPEEVSRERFQVREGYGRGGVGKERRGAAGDQGEQEVPVPEGSRELLGPARGLHALLVRLGMGGEDHLQPLRGGFVAVLGDDKPALEALAEELLGGTGHRPRRLARREHEDPLRLEPFVAGHDGAPFEPHGAPDGLCGVGGREARGEYRSEVFLHRRHCIGARHQQEVPEA
jgi:hypothetical protein